MHYAKDPRPVIRGKLVIAVILSGKQAAEFIYSFIYLLFCHVDYMNMTLIRILQNSIEADNKTLYH